MVTFSTDYWAPAMEVNVRRRQEKSPLHPQNSSLPSYHNADHWNTLRQVPTIDDTSLTSSSPLARPRRKSVGNVLSSVKSTHPVSPTTSSASPLLNTIASPPSSSSKRHNLIHKIFHPHESKPSSNQHSPPQSPVEDPFLSSSALDKKNPFNLKAHVLGRASSAGSERSDSRNAVAVQPDCTLLKKYGMCDKGSIGQGATAVVRLAHKLSSDQDTVSEKLFAVKEFRKRRKDETEKEYVKKLTSEFCISSTLHHENIVETVDLVQDEQHHWCEVMEYCRGGDLYNAIKQGHMSRTEVDCCFKQLINGIAYLHSMGVAHRDIKPENLLLDGQGRLKITDFGVSDVFRMCWEKTPHLSKGLCGSEPYIAPEEFKSKEYDARRVDIWACGIVYYCMVYQGIPFRAAVAQDPNYQLFVDMRSVNNYEPFEKLPTGCRKLMKRILDPNPETRITMEDILEDEWFKSIETCLHGENQDPHRH
ncbi:serine/threonine-protein kinase HAL4/sat4 [Podila epicladia]|nr:serine/threonine-protein kinase HAL4/sat4 [Podila epicladia]KAG0099595.1 serine/threonine-protein kinase HAL4/sat4 [Podila epicladia]